MMTRTASRWLMSVALAVLALVAINLLVTTAPVQGRPAAALINCSGSIQACIDAANDGDTILIAAGRYTESLTLSKPVSLTGENRDTTIIHAVAGQRVLTVTGVTISNSVVISGLTFTGGESDLGGGISIGNDAQPVLASIAVVGNSATYGGGIVAPILILRDSLVSNNSGGGVVASLANVTGSQFTSNTLFSALGADTLFLTGTQFLNNTASEGGGIYVSQSAHIINAHFENNRCTGEYCGGGGIKISPYFSGSLVLRSATFINNSAYDGGAVSSDKSVLIEDSSFISNTANNYGGGLYASGIATISDTDFISNSSANDGGGLYADSVRISAGKLTGNHVGLHGYGGGLRAATLLVTDTQFISNAASIGGGAWAGDASLNGGRFENNHSLLGGGLAVGALVLSGTEFVGNSADFGGGGAWAYDGATLIGGLFENNRSENNFGGGLQASGALVITGTQFASNTTGGSGGGLYFSDWYGSSDARIVNVLLAQNTAGVDGTALALHATGNLEVLNTTIADMSPNSKSAISAISNTLYLTNIVIASHTLAISNTGGTVYEDYNLFFDTITNTVGVTNGGHSLIGDPKFVDPLNGDYHLQFGSAAIDHGIDAGVYTDLDGKPRPVGAGFDIGAYEYQAIKVVYLPLIRK
jgi:predicted outer membrane repeat protein